MNPIVTTSLGQWEPWNKYVAEEHPGSPVGCVAVAAATVMSYAKPSLLNYHNSNFYLRYIIKQLNNGPHDENANVMNNSIPVTDDISTDTIAHNAGDYPQLPPMTYEKAVDHMAKFLYHISNDVNMKYSADGSVASAYDAYKLITNLGFDVSPYNYSFSISNVIEYLDDNYICYLRGSNVNGIIGHAWVADGYRYCVSENDSSQIIDSFINCDWGWGGKCNGYFSGKVFETIYGDYKPSSYFGVKREWSE